MARVYTRTERRRLRAKHVRSKISGTPERPRMSVRVSNKGVYVQFIDDMNEVSLGGVSIVGTKKVEEAKNLGVRAAELLKEKSIEQVVFDRGGMKYHGRLKAIGDAVREAGIKL